MKADAKAAAAFVAQIDTLMDDDAASWAFTTLDDIRSSVIGTGFVTPGQEEAVANIAAAVKRQAIKGRSLDEDALPSSRRADGFMARRHEGGE